MLPNRSTLLLLCLCAPLGACVSPPDRTGLARPEPVFSPAAFFMGKTIGEGDLQVVLSGGSATHVVGEGSVSPHGTLVLVQRVQRGDEAPTTRTWRLRPVGQGHYLGTLSSAESPVEGEVSGNELHLHFVADGGLDTEQWLYLQPGGRVALNRMVVRKFGLPVAALDETIRKTD